MWILTVGGSLFYANALIRKLDRKLLGKGCTRY